MNKQINKLVALSLFSLFAFTKISFAQAVSVYDLTVEHQTNPLSVDNPNPRFSWKLKSSAKNTRQVSYEIKLSANLSRGKNLWNTNKTGDQSVLVPYNGPTLTSKTKYYWQVRVKDNHGNLSPWSSVQYFQTGLKPDDWSAKWITVGGPDTALASPMFRKTFELKKKIQSATVFVTAKGIYEMHINGKRLGNQYLAPGWTSYREVS